MKFHVKKNDEVIIIAGDDKGKKGRLFVGARQKSGVFVVGLNINSNKKKQNQKTPHGGIVKTPGSIHISNVQLISDGKATRVGRKEEKGKTVRVARKTGKILD
jgi:large subunit ribosomal protein L24